MENVPTERRPGQSSTTVSVIAPTYNEYENVEPLVRALEVALGEIDYEIVICDDDSPDRTWFRAEQIAEQNPRVRVLRRTVNRGLGNAVIDGFISARGNVVACIDADLQHDPSILPQMLNALQNGSEIVVGTRYMSGGGTSDWNRLRRFGSWLATKGAQWVLGVKLHDPMSGYFMLRRDDFCRVSKDLNGEGFKILLEIVAKLRPVTVGEVPFTFRARTAGKSKLSRKAVQAYLGQLWRLSVLGRALPEDFFKFATVGGMGVVVNLVVLAVILRLTPYHDWWASCMSSLVATVHNYVLNNFWTFRNRAHRGMACIRRYFMYLIASLVGLGATTLSYVGIERGLANLVVFQRGTAMPKSVLLLCQLLAISVGIFCNYSLNRATTWRHPVLRSQVSAGAAQSPEDASWPGKRLQPSRFSPNN